MGAAEDGGGTADGRKEAAGADGCGMRDCIAAVEAAFVSHAQGQTLGPAVLGVHVDGGGFHVKAAGDNVSERPANWSLRNRA